MGSWGAAELRLPKLYCRWPQMHSELSVGCFLHLLSSVKFVSLLILQWTLLLLFFFGK